MVGKSGEKPGLLDPPLSLRGRADISGQEPSDQQQQRTVQFWDGDKPGPFLISGSCLELFHYLTTKKEKKRSEYGKKLKAASLSDL